MNRRVSWRTALRALAIALIPIAAGACDTSPTASGNAKLSIFLKDGPGAVDAVWLQIDDIVLMGDAGQVSMLDAPTDLINVTDLTDAVTTLVDGHPLPAGEYSEVRFVLGGAVLQTGDQVYSFGDITLPEGLEATGTLQCPSCAQSGIKVKLSAPLDVQEGDNGLLLDFDVAQSFGHQAGNSGRWVMHPVVHGASAQVAEPAPAGTITGTVALDTDVTIPTCGGGDQTLADFVPNATATTLTDGEGAALVFSGHTDPAAEGFTFGIDVSDFDTFTLGYDPETVFDTDKLVWTAEVVPTSAVVDGDHTLVDGVAYTITAVTCEAVSP